MTKSKQAPHHSATRNSCSASSIRISFVSGWRSEEVLLAPIHTA